MFSEYAHNTLYFTKSTRESHFQISVNALLFPSFDSVPTLVIPATFQVVKKQT